MQKAVILFLVAAVSGFAQFTSGSNGSDGALSIPDGSGTVVFDPFALGIDLDGDNIFHFTTITIGSDSTLVLKASKMRKNTAIVFLASGAVSIGTNSGLNLNGENGVPTGASAQTTRRPSEPGPGGFAGGLSNRINTSTGALITPATDGFGPPGSRGVAATSGCASGASASSSHLSISMVPLAGGAGGAGAVSCSGTGANGGAGGGAIRIVSSSQIAFGTTAFIRANGGSGAATGTGTFGGHGGGGLIHLIAPAITFSSGAVLSASNPVSTDPTPLVNGSGVVRLNATTITGTPTGNPVATSGALFAMPLPEGQPEVLITQVNGNNVANPPSGLLTGADVLINTASASTVNISARNIPVGTVVTLRISSEVVADQTLTCSPLAGTLASSAATCQATFPLGSNITIATASW